MEKQFIHNNAKKIWVHYYVLVYQEFIFYIQNYIVFEMQNILVQCIFV
jgi:hypothetical protein